MRSLHVTTTYHTRRPYTYSCLILSFSGPTRPVCDLFLLFVLVTCKPYCTICPFLFSLLRVLMVWSREPKRHQSSTQRQKPSPMSLQRYVLFYAYVQNIFLKITDVISCPPGGSRVQLLETDSSNGWNQ